MEKQSWKIAKAGNINNLRLTQEQQGPLSAYGIRVRTAAVGLNFADVFALQGLYSATPQGAFVPGLEFSGTVLEAGERVTRFKKGDRVMGATRFGGYSTVVDSDESHCVHLPEQWSFLDGAAFPVQTITAWYALHSLGQVHKGQNVLVHSAAGGVGLQALKIAVGLGANVFGTVSSENKKSFLREQGFNGIVIRSEQWAKDLQILLHGRPLHLALDAVGGKVQKESYQLLAPTGRLVIFGAATFMAGSDRPNPVRLVKEYLTRPRLDPLRMIHENKSVMAFNLIWLWEHKELMEQLMKEVVGLNITPPHVGKVFPFNDAPAAVRYLQSGQSIGKVLLEVN